MPIWELDEGELPASIKAFNDAYLGEISAANFITGDALSAQLALTAGTSINSDAGWLKFTKDGTTLYMAKRPVRQAISYTTLVAAGLLDGSAQITIGEGLYKVRLPSGAEADPAALAHNTDNPAGTQNSDWNRLLEQVCKDTPKSRWPTFTSTDLGVGGMTAGTSTWCSNKSDWGQTNTPSPGYSVVRGYNGILNYYVTTQSNAGVANAFRPVLEYLGRSPLADDKYLGEVAAADAITGPALATATGLTSGTSINTTSGWLKFQLGQADGKIKTLLVAKKPFRYGLSFNQLKAKSLLKGGTSAPRVTIGGKQYIVRCIRAADLDPATANHNTINPKGTRNSEWARTVQNVAASMVGGRGWAAFSDADLGATHSGSTYANGASTICMEDSTLNQGNGAASGYFVLMRSITNYFVTTVANVNADIGWRPVLELVD